MRSALRIQAAAARTQKRLGRLRVAVRRLNTIRRTISKKVDILCNDLVSAYGELSKQVDQVRLAESFGMAARQVADPDELADALSDALARDEPALLTAKVGEMPDPWSYIHLPRVRG